jgi:hypothetical protein
MQLIQPCCTQLHWPALRNKLKNGKTELFHGKGDLSLAELLPVILLPYSETDILLACPTLPDLVSETLLYWMRRELPRIDGRSKFHVVKNLTIITNLCEKRSPIASRWLQENPFPGRLELRNVQQNNTAIILPDLALYGPINLVYCGHFIATATKDQKIIEELRNELLSIRQ